MPTKIFVGRLADGISSDDIRSLFQKFGAITECDVLTNIAFVHMESEEEAKAAIAALDGHRIRGSQISVELSTSATQGRKRKFDNPGPSFRGGGRGGPPNHSAPYPARQDLRQEIDDRRRYNVPPSAAPPQQREEFASDQVKDLLELYIRDPAAFDQYARTYYYGERAQRQLAAAQHNGRMMPDRFQVASSSYRR